MADDNKIEIKTELTEIKADPKRVKPTWVAVEDISDGAVPDYDAEVLQSTVVADQYRSSHYVAYNKPDSTSFQSLKVLQELWGRPWDQCALNFVHALRPSGIRVTRGEIKLDARTWRVTVYLEDDDRTILRIEQEVAVGCVGAQHGYGLRRYVLGQGPEPILGFYNKGGLERLQNFAEKQAAKMALEDVEMALTHLQEAGLYAKAHNAPDPMIYGGTDRVKLGGIWTYQNGFQIVCEGDQYVARLAGEGQMTIEGPVDSLGAAVAFVIGAYANKADDK